MSDDIDDFLKEAYVGDAEELTPEQIFKLITIIPNRSIRVKAYLVDESGDRVETSEIAKDLVKYVEEQMKAEENNTINTQVFPLIAQLMVSYVPRVVGLPMAELLFAAPNMRATIVHMGMAAFLMLQYIRQHKLKIVTEEEQISDSELALMRQRDQEGQAALDRAIRSAMKGAPYEEPDDN